MCKTCGCSDTEAAADEGHAHHHPHGHENGVAPLTTTVRLEQAILERNDRLAQDNRD